MHNEHDDRAALDRRDFFKTAGAGLTAAAVVLAPRDAALAQEAARKAAVDRIAANTYPIRPLFKSRFTGAAAEAMRRNNARQSPRPRGRGGGAGPRTPTPLVQLAVANAATAARANLPNAEQMKARDGEITMYWTSRRSPRRRSQA